MWQALNLHRANRDIMDITQHQRFMNNVKWWSENIILQARGWPSWYFFFIVFFSCKLHFRLPFYQQVNIGSFHHYLFLIDTVWEGDGAYTSEGKEGEEIHVQESNKQRECDVTFYLDVMTQLFLSIAKFVFPKVQQADFTYSSFNAGMTLLGSFRKICIKVKTHNCTKRWVPLTMLFIMLYKFRWQLCWFVHRGF